MEIEKKGKKYQMGLPLLASDEVCRKVVLMEYSIILPLEGGRKGERGWGSPYYSVERHKFLSAELTNTDFSPNSNESVY